MKILHVTTGLGDGGAEAVLYRLILNDPSSEHLVVSLSGLGKYGPLLRSRGINVYSLGMTRGRPSLFAIFRILRIVREQNPDAVQGWMYHGNLLASFCRLVYRDQKVFWGIHHSQVEDSSFSFGTRIVFRALAFLSRWVPVGIIYCAWSAKNVHERSGFSKSKGHVISNGYDLDNFQISRELRDATRHELGIRDDEVLVGMVARWHPDKDHRTFLEAISRILDNDSSLRFVFVGSELDSSNVELSKLIDSFGVRSNCILLGRRDDIPAIMNAIDLKVLSSVTEAFPNVLAEAMACGTPCIATDVGDVSEILGSTGWVVSPANPREMADSLLLAIAEVGSDSYFSRSANARSRIVDLFSIDKMVTKYHSIWRKC